MADKKLLEESVIARFQQLANINGGSKAGVLTESKGAGGVPYNMKERFAGDSDAKEERRNPAGLRETEDLEEDLTEAEDEGDMEADAGEMDLGGDDAAGAGDEMGAPMEGGDLESAVSTLVDALNGVLAAAGMDDKQVELDSGEGEGEGEEAPGEEAPDMEAEAEPMAEKKEATKQGWMKKEAKKPMEEEVVEEDALEESVELVDDALIEKLVQRVSARLVAEARKAKSLAEGKGGKGWLTKVAKAKPPTNKGSPKGKVGTPFNKSMSVKGTAGRGGKK